MNGPLLVIDASTYRGTAAVIDGERVIAETEARMRGADEERLMPAIAGLLREAHLELPALAGVVCGEGPGSFTSLRIAASIAKGLVSATGHPFLAVSSLLLLVGGASQPLAEGRYLGLLDAMRGEWFGARLTVDNAGRARLDGAWDVMSHSAIEQITSAESRSAIGPGQGIEASPHARGLARVAVPGEALRMVDARTWEPAYGRLPEAQARWEQSHGRPLVA
jgi:tRNA threonylcarbamoyladenosine biosynthesis protein TsaB